MDTLRELVKYLKNQDNGASMGELKEVCPEDALKSFIKAGMASGEIFAEGKKRGTRYYVKGATPVPKQEKEAKAEIEEYADSLDKGDLESVLKSNTPIPGQGVYINTIRFGKDDPSLKSFLNSGVVIEHSYVQYDKQIKHNVVVEKSTQTIYNRIGFRQHGRYYELQKFNTHNNSISSETFKSYEDFRESIRALFA